MRKEGLMKIIVYCGILLMYYILAAYATTDISRLLKGATLPITSSACYCPICGHKIRLIDQIPIISYFINHGKCHYCKNKIPFSDLFLEVFLFSSFSLITFLTHFQWDSFLLCILLYETVKIISILLHGKREHAFLYNLACSLFNNVILFSLLATCFVLAQL